MMTPDLYFDNAATTRPHSDVIESMIQVMRQDFGNPSSLHRRGVRASTLVAEAAQNVSLLLDGGEWRVVFTSGGTEANNLAILGIAPMGNRDSVVISSLEHSSVDEACDAVVAAGGRKIVVRARSGGVIDPADVLSAVDERTALVSLVHVAPEMGTIQPVQDIARLVRQRWPRVRIHVDAVQAAVSMERMDYPDEVDLVTLSAHKLYGPMGVGALLRRSRVALRPLLFGGDQQHRIRPGTLNVPGIVGMGVAARRIRQYRFETAARYRERTELLRERIQMHGVRLLGHPEARASAMVVVAVSGVRSEVLLHTLEKYGLYASSGSACHASRRTISSCLVDEGVRPEEGVVRFSPGMETTADDIERAATIFTRAVHDVRSGAAGRTG